MGLVTKFPSELRLVRISPASLTCRPISFHLSFFSFLFLATTSFLSPFLARNRLYDVVIGQAEGKDSSCFPTTNLDVRFIYICMYTCTWYLVNGDTHGKVEKIRSKISWIKFSFCEKSKYL